MNAKQKKFIDEYLIDLNAERAAIRAGYSPKYARGNAHKLVANGCIQERIEKSMVERAKRTEISQDEVVQALANISFADVTEYAQIVTIGSDQVVLIKDTDQLQRDKSYPIKSIKQGRFGIEIELYDKMKALELLGRHLGMFKDKVEISGQLNNPFKDISTEDLKKALGIV